MMIYTSKFCFYVQIANGADKTFLGLSKTNKPKPHTMKAVCFTWFYFYFFTSS